MSLSQKISISMDFWGSCMPCISGRIALSTSVLCLFLTLHEQQLVSWLHMPDWKHVMIFALPGWWLCEEETYLVFEMGLFRKKNCNWRTTAVHFHFCTFSGFVAALPHSDTVDRHARTSLCWFSTLFLSLVMSSSLQACKQVNRH